MEIVNGVVVLGLRPCSPCQGTGEIMRRVPCPQYGKVTNRRPCPHCGSTRKDGHAYLDRGLIGCPTCNERMVQPETLSDYLPPEVWSTLKFQVYDTGREATWNERMLGVGCVYSVQDYGRSAALTDEELIESIKGIGVAARSCQASAITDREGRLADHIGIFRNRSGYSVRAVYATPDGLAIRTASISGLGGGVRAAVEASGGI